MATKVPVQGDGRWLAGGETEGTSREMIILQALYEKINAMDIKLNLVQFTVDQIYKCLPTQLNSYERFLNTDDVARLRVASNESNSSGYIVINSHNNAKPRSGEKCHTPKGMTDDPESSDSSDEDMKDEKEVSEPFFSVLEVPASGNDATEQSAARSEELQPGNLPGCNSSYPVAAGNGVIYAPREGPGEVAKPRIPPGAGARNDEEKGYEPGNQQTEGSEPRNDLRESSKQMTDVSQGSGAENESENSENGNDKIEHSDTGHTVAKGLKPENYEAHISEIRITVTESTAPGTESENDVIESSGSIQDITEASRPGTDVLEGSGQDNDGVKDSESSDDESESSSSQNDLTDDSDTELAKKGEQFFEEIVGRVDDRSKADRFEKAASESTEAVNVSSVNFNFPEIVRRAESPIPVAVKRVGYGWCRSKEVDVSDDNRARYFTQTASVDVGETGDVEYKRRANKAEGVSNNTVSPQKTASESDLSETASGGFVPNNQLMTTSGFRNDHGPKDNRFVNEAHNDSPSFLRTIGNELSNMALIENGIRMHRPGHNSSVRPPVQTIGLEGSGFMRPLAGANGEEDERVRAELPPGGDSNRSSRANSFVGKASSPARSGTSSPLTTAARPSSGTAGQRDSDSEKDPLVGDAYIQALIQTQKREALNNAEPKSQGLDTVICLDTSHSMAGTAMEQAKQVILTFLDGLEAATVDYELEENVSIVTFGKENKVQQHLTNNYDAIRDQLESLEAGGPSPLWLGLALSLTELSTRGGSCKMTDLSVLPRIILISDGFATEKNRLSGTDRDVRAVTASEQQALEDFDCSFLIRSQIMSLVGKNAGSVSHIDCVTVGDHNKDLLSDVSGFRVFTSEDLQYLVEFFRVKDITNTCIAASKDGQMTEQKMKSMLTACNLQEHRSVKDVVLEIAGKVSMIEETPPDVTAHVPETEPELQQAQTDVPESSIRTQEVPKDSQKTPTETPDIPTETPQLPRNERPIGSRRDRTFPAEPTLETDTTSMTSSTSERDQMFMSTGSDSGQVSQNNTDFPAFGTRVVASPDWEKYVHKKDLVGTVVGHRKDRLKVLWPDGVVEKCCYGENDQYDVMVKDDVEMDTTRLGIGSKVMRGEDWKWGDQDGGEGSIGIVYKMDEKKKTVLVVWANNQQGNYRYGYKNYFDVQPVPSNPDIINQDKGKADIGDHKVVWEIEMHVLESDWCAFPEEVNQSIEDMYTAKPKNTFLIKVNDTSYRISLNNSQARDITTQQVYQIRRLVIPKESHT